MEENNEEKGLKKLFNEYGGAIIGGIVALVLCFTNLYRILVYIVIILAGIVVGDYVQKNKTNVKDKLKEIIDKF